ncbi:putative component of NuA3 histone acetyltransferase complex [Teratosphaeriaceae sp. CCFEE 6253]|nr:putative component of NuA3 histone acetyltransferase complex [Teratosphaeriaceae sp. CCFEE 6253]
MKRKAETLDDGDAATNGHAKRPATSPHGAHGHFGPGIFDDTTVNQYATAYATSEPYKHAVISNLIDDTLLRSVRAEIIDNIHFTPKETDIYKIHQSGDLANLSGLDAPALAKLPSLLQLRDALYGPQFREWIQAVSGCGALSGTKTDMAVNVYVPGCHLLCHDDVIGTRRVSYILYLTDPATPWQAHWGGALRLYATDERTDEGGKVFKVPRAEWSKVIPPAWNQLSFFAVQPGESFHDVEEVYHGSEGGEPAEGEGGRVRMAISGWFHIPQEGEAGYELGLEQRMAERSSLQQLQGTADQFDEPRVEWIEPLQSGRHTNDKGATNGGNIGAIDDDDDDNADDALSEHDLTFLLRFMNPHYLTPDTVAALQHSLAQDSAVHLADFLSQTFSARLLSTLQPPPATAAAAAAATETLLPNAHFATARPPHKHRFLFYSPPHSASLPPAPQNPYTALSQTLLPSPAFKKWLALVADAPLERCAILARRFRRGMDYQLAQGYGGEWPRLEYTLGITPSRGWGGAVEAEGMTGAEEEGAEGVGGDEIYMVGEDAELHMAHEDDGGVAIPSSAAQHIASHTGAGDRPSTQRNLKPTAPAPAPARASDPAVYQSAGGKGEEDEDGGVLISNAPSWNTLSVVIRDQGTMRFVKYVSRRAPGDRWDVVGMCEMGEGVDDEEDEDGKGERERDGFGDGDGEDDDDVGDDDGETDVEAGA